MNIFKLFGVVWAVLMVAFVTGDMFTPATISLLGLTLCMIADCKE